MDLDRRAKYMLLIFSHGTLLIHLGMSGNLRLMHKESPLRKHDHIDIVLKDKVVRFNDPRRFGCFIWEKKNQQKSLLSNLGYEPLEDEFNGATLYKMTRNRKLAIKILLMTNHYISGLGNIYVTESLWRTRISPFRPANELRQEECNRLAKIIKDLLSAAIKAGGTSIRDYQGADGRSGYFRMQLNTYGKEKEACPNCKTPIERRIQGQRSTFFCPQCQK